MEPFSDRNQSDIVGISGSRVSGIGKGLEMESDERLLSIGGIDMRLNDEVSESGFVDDQNIGENLVQSRLGRNLEDEQIEASEVGEFDGINLVVDFNMYFRKGIDQNGVESSEKMANNIEFIKKIGEYEVSDLVWAKVKSHPWWPGRIFDPSASTNKARKYYKKDSFLVAFFGDQTFAWNESFKMKPFRVNFSKMVKQSNAESFYRAVDRALDEAARRVEFGLACSCLSEGEYAKIRSLVIINDGIREELSRIEGGDRFSTVDSFRPAGVFQAVQDIAKDPFAASRLEVSTVRAQVSAFSRWKGYYQLCSNQILEENVHFDATNDEIAKNGNSTACGSVLRKHKHVFEGDFRPIKKVRSLSELMLNGNYGPSGPGGNSNSKKMGHKRKDLQSPNADEFLLQIRLAAKNPMYENLNVNPLLGFASDFTNYRQEMNSESRGVDQTEEIASRFTGIEDSYWTDRIIQIDANEHKSDPFESSPKSNKENSPTALILKFTSFDSIPSVTNLNVIFSRYGPIREPKTEVLKKKNCAKVLFERRSDAETAFSRAGKFSIFGPALVSYCINYSPTPRKTPKTGRKQNKRSGKSAKMMQFEN